MDLATPDVAHLIKLGLALGASHLAARYFAPRDQLVDAGFAR